VLFTQLGRVLSKSKLIQPGVTKEHILPVYEAAVLISTKKTTKSGLAVFTKTVLLLLAMKLSAKNLTKDTKVFVFDYSHQPRQSNWSVFA